MNHNTKDDMDSNLQSQQGRILAERTVSTALGIQNWLMNSGIQIREGMQEGGICGWLNEHGEADFVYLEATGYFLTFCTFLTRLSREFASTAMSRADRALDWLSRQLRHNHPFGSRQYLSEALTDWRSGMSFSFDLAMAYRGIQAATAVFPRPVSQSVLHQLSMALTVFCQAGLLQPCGWDGSATGGSFPIRWSTRCGPYQLKTAAALLFHEQPILPPVVQSSAEQTCLF
jgi:hypothetical protein